MEEGEWNRHIKRMRLVYKRKMQHLVSFFLFLLSFDEGLGFIIKGSNNFLVNGIK
ncbi:Uncharacterised protein [Streptococcus pneumoniae]|nr:Uncharacterised protein [Streptococcus pneumoniae]